MEIDGGLILSFVFAIRPLTDDEGGGCMFEHEDLPGGVSDGATLEEALKNGVDAARGHLMSCAERGEAEPQTGSGPWLQGGLKSLHAQLVAQAGQEGVSLNSGPGEK